MNNPVLDAILSRSSIRAYTDEPLTIEEMCALSDAALSAPTAMNRRKQRFYFVTDKALMSEMEEAVAKAYADENDTVMVTKMVERDGKVFYNAPLFIAVAIDAGSVFTPTDAGIAVGTLAIAAKSLGLDSVILGMPRKAFAGESAEYFKKRLSMDDDLEFCVGIAIGHADMVKAPHDVDSTHVIFINE